MDAVNNFDLMFFIYKVDSHLPWLETYGDRTAINPFHV